MSVLYQYTDIRAKHSFLYTLIQNGYSFCKHYLKGHMKQNRNFLFCNCPCAFNSPLLRNIVIFYLNLFKHIKFALKVIDLNRPAPNLQLGLGTNYDVGSCTQQYFLSSSSTNSAKKSNKRFRYSSYAMFCFDFFAITADGKLSIQLPMSYFVRKPQFKLGAGLFISITLRANLIIKNHYIPEQRTIKGTRTVTKQHIFYFASYAL